MALLIKLVACVALASVAATLPTSGPQTQDSYIPQSYEEPAAFPLPAGLQLPRAESAPVPFYVPELATFLKAPQYNPQPSYYQVPAPAQDLVAPVEAWNPEHDPKFYYEVPAIITQQDSPTNSFPKKFNKDLHVKSKPFASKPKQEIVLQAIDEDEYNEKQKSLSKVFEKLAKQENRKRIALQSQQAV